MAQPKLLIVDANVLIDYVKAELEVIALTARYVGPVHLARALLREVKGLSETKARQLGLQLVDPSLAQLLEAGESRGALSFEDRLCLILARDEGWTCVTNDRRLRTECSSEGVSVLWGLQLMIELVKTGRLRAGRAIAIAKSIQASNPQHITAGIVRRFERKVSETQP